MANIIKLEYYRLNYHYRVHPVRLPCVRFRDGRFFAYMSSASFCDAHCTCVAMYESFIGTRWTNLPHNVVDSGVTQLPIKLHALADSIYVEWFYSTPVSNQDHPEIAIYSHWHPSPHFKTPFYTFPLQKRMFSITNSFYFFKGPRGHTSRFTT